MIVNLFSTANLSSGRSDALSRMIASVSATARARPDIDLRLMILLQCCGEAPADLLSQEDARFVTLLTTPGLVSLSAARNRLLDEGRRLGWMHGDEIVAFPDDDCWYPEGALGYIHDAFARQPDLDFWFCDYASAPVPVDGSIERDASVQDVLRRASSNTMVFRSPIVREIGGFDPELGVGARLNGSEDTDYALRALALCRRTRFMPLPSIGHRDRNTAIRAKYYPSGLLVIARHAGRIPALRSALLRKLAVGSALTARGELKPGTFLAATRDAMGEMRRTRQRSLR
ncbi:glycosyltransferase family 2 protein [Aureimonas phyllosphaerae]|uniref:Glycosyl transferase family 2 n=1 Tax=Aureimonas phyllosphaerae TaxID=1166078 RepID=A0A7W6C1K2_9HYPH|nr:glycosyltransferase family A protein [Aureimonas phyllosphaerae]MBB3936762.1 hypothetical protein [Aureimonas phyllosphaerae]MBB3960375.1 hypothetical protein [Aureimonas phyllosphaerae]SFF22206.1 hypothetical protein SAMN05216566_10513 [Aureimonas phyllosphaerae]